MTVMIEKYSNSVSMMFTKMVPCTAWYHILAQIGTENIFNNRTVLAKTSEI